MITAVITARDSKRHSLREIDYYSFSLSLSLLRLKGDSVPVTKADYSGDAKLFMDVIKGFKPRTQYGVNMIALILRGSVSY